MAFCIQFIFFFLSLNEMIAIFSDPLYICYETLAVLCGICLLHSFYLINKIQKTLVKQTWPGLTNSSRAGISFKQGWIVFFRGGRVRGVLWVGYS